MSTAPQDRVYEGPRGLDSLLSRDAAITINRPILTCQPARTIPLDPRLMKAIALIIGHHTHEASEVEAAPALHLHGARRPA